MAGVRGTPPGLGVGAERRRPAGHALRRRLPAVRVSTPGPRTTARRGHGTGHPSTGSPPAAASSPATVPRPGPVWGSLTDRPGGSATTAWYATASGWRGATPVVLAAGNLVAGGGTTLTAVYGRRDGADVTPLGPRHRSATTPARRTGARSRCGRPRAPTPSGSRPSTRPARSTAGSPSPRPRSPGRCRCRRCCPRAAPSRSAGRSRSPTPAPGRPAVVDGITEPATYGVTRAAAPDGPPLAGLADMAWAADRGGVYAHVPRSQSVLRVPDRRAGRPVPAGVRVHVPAGAATRTCSLPAGAPWPGPTPGSAAPPPEDRWPRPPSG